MEVDNSHKNNSEEVLRQVNLRAHANAILDLGQGVLGYIETHNLIEEYLEGEFEGIYHEIADVCKERETREKGNIQE